jgi:predicted GNAT family acetyltransferase
MIRAATPADHDALMGYLAPHAATSMFLMSNLTAGQPGFHIIETSGTLTGVVQLSPAGYLLAQSAPLSPPDAAALRAAFAGQSCQAASGTPAQVEAALTALSLTQHARAVDRIEPLFTLNTAHLTIPNGPTHLQTIGPDAVETVLPWRLAFLREVLGLPDTTATRATARAQSQSFCDTGHARFLIANGTPVAMTAFNATTPGFVQVGSVYTLPAHRGQGHARRMVALHLAEARATGTHTAFLYAANPTAARAYQSIGFRQTGDYRLLQFATTARIVL